MAQVPYEYCEIVKGLFFINWPITAVGEINYNTNERFVDLQKLVHNEFGTPYNSSEPYIGSEITYSYPPLNDDISGSPTRPMSEKWICGLFLKLPQLTRLVDMPPIPSIEPGILSEKYAAIAGLHCNCFPDAIEIYNVAVLIKNSGLGKLLISIVLDRLYNRPSSLLRHAIRCSSEMDAPPKTQTTFLSAEQSTIGDTTFETRMALYSSLGFTLTTNSERLLHEYVPPPFRNAPFQIIMKYTPRLNDAILDSPLLKISNSFITNINTTSPACDWMIVMVTHGQIAPVNWDVGITLDKIRKEDVKNVELVMTASGPPAISQIAFETPSLLSVLASTMKVSKERLVAKFPGPQQAHSIPSEEKLIELYTRNNPYLSSEWADLRIGLALSAHDPTAHSGLGASILKYILRPPTASDTDLVKNLAGIYVFNGSYILNTYINHTNAVFQNMFATETGEISIGDLVPRLSSLFEHMYTKSVAGAIPQFRIGIYSCGTIPSSRPDVKTLSLRATPSAMTNIGEVDPGTLWRSYKSSNQLSALLYARMFETTGIAMELDGGARKRRSVSHTRRKPRRKPRRAQKRRRVTRSKRSVCHKS